MTIGQLLSVYLETHLAGRASYGRSKRLIERECAPWFTLPLDALSKQAIRAKLTIVGEVHHHGPHANKLLGVLRAAWNWGLESGLHDVAANPTAGIRRFRMQARERFLNQAELRYLMSRLLSLPIKPQAYFLASIYLGTRPGELRQMRWDDLDCASRRWHKGVTKTGGRHYLPIPQQVADLLSALPHTSAYVFPGDHGQPWSAASVRKAWAVFRKSCLAGRPSLADVRHYDLRRTLATWMIDRDVQLPVVQKALNHVSLQSTEIYTRVSVRKLDEELQRQADVFEALGRESPPIPPRLHGVR